MEMTLYIAKKTNQVIFGEVEEDVVDYLLSIPSLPIPPFHKYANYMYYRGSNLKYRVLDNLSFHFAIGYEGIFESLYSLYQGRPIMEELIIKDVQLDQHSAARLLMASKVTKNILTRVFVEDNEIHEFDDDDDAVVDDNFDAFYGNQDEDGENIDK